MTHLHNVLGLAKAFCESKKYFRVFLISIFRKLGQKRTLLPLYKGFDSLMCKIATSAYSAQRSRSNADMATIDVFKLCFTMTHSKIFAELLQSIYNCCRDYESRFEL